MTARLCALLCLIGSSSGSHLPFIDAHVDDEVDHEEKEHSGADAGRETDIVLRPAQAVHISRQHFGAVDGASTSGKIDEVEIVEGPQHMDGDHDYDHVADARQRHVAKPVPCTGTIDLGGFVIGPGYGLHRGQKGDAIEGYISPQVHHHDEWEGKLQVTKPVGHELPLPDRPEEDVDDANVRLSDKLENGGGRGDGDYPARHDDALERSHAGEFLLHHRRQDQPEHELQENHHYGQDDGMAQGQPEHGIGQHLAEVVQPDELDDVT